MAGKESSPFTYHAKVGLTWVCTYLKSSDRKYQSGAREKSNENLKNNKTRQQLSKKALSKLRCYIGSLITFSSLKTNYNDKYKGNFKWRVNFITLTLPAEQKHTDQKIKADVLGNWLTTAKRQKGFENYIWKAEPQENGNIHFHILSNHYLDKYWLQKSWNGALENLGYITEFEKKHHHRNPPSTQIHSVKKIGNIGAYFSKYMCKGNERRPIQGRIWYASENIQKVKPFSITMDSNNAMKLNNALDKNFAWIGGENYTQVYVNNGDLKAIRKVDRKPKIIIEHYEKIQALLNNDKKNLHEIPTHYTWKKNLCTSEIKLKPQKKILTNSAKLLRETESTAMEYYLKEAKRIKEESQKN